MSRSPMGLLRNLLAVLALGLGLGPSAQAHEPSQAFLTLQSNGTELTGRWDVSVQDLEEAVGIDTDGDRAVTWGELQSRRSALQARADGWLTLSSQSGPCELSIDQRALDTHGGLTYAVLGLSARCPAVVEELTLDYRFLADIDPTHRLLVQIGNDEAVSTALLSTGDGPLRVSTTEPQPASTFVGFVVQGALHIWEGYDHLAFLGLLLLGTLLGRRRHRDTRAATWAIAKIVTAFTIAHSVTLALATWGLIDLPTRAVELVIAASIAVTAIVNLHPRAPAMSLPLAFAFGLVHGLGFASALRGLDATVGNQLLSLAGFNIGVELGQLAIVLLSLPLLLAAARSTRWRQPALTVGSIALGSLGVAWFVERLG